jgi:hypothetical protein
VFDYRRQITIDHTKVGAITSTWQIPANDRDAWDDVSSGDINSSEFGDSQWQDAGGYQWPVNIPQGAKIISARVKVYSTQHQGATTSDYTARIRVEDVENASAFTGRPNDIYNRTFHTTTVDWTIPATGLLTNTWNESPDIKDLIQHVVNKTGWSSGNYLSVAIWGETTNGTGSLELINDYNSDPSLAAQLEVTYQTSGAGGAPLENFPLLVSMSDQTWLKNAQNGGKVAHTQGYDIVFRESDGKTQLDHEIEKYDGSNGTLVAWVRIPTLSQTANTTIYMYYGNCAVSVPTENPEAVWDDDYVGVWHLEESVTDEQTTGTHDDSTSNGNDGSQSGNEVYSNGKIAEAQDFDGTDDYVDLDSHIGNYASLSEGSISIWFNYTDTSDYKLLFSASCNTDDNSDLDIMYYQPDDVFMSGIREDSSNVWNCSFPANYADGSWHHYVMTVDSSGNNHYVDGTKITCDYQYGGDASTQAFFNSVTGLNTLRMGNREDSGGTQYHFGGNLDEVRISKVARSEEWLITSYGNQSATNKTSSYSECDPDAACFTDDTGLMHINIEESSPQTDRQYGL